MLNREVANCSTCHWWKNEDEFGETCFGDHDTKPDYVCEQYQAKRTTATCGECKWLHTPMRNKTCYRHYHRQEDDPYCNPPLTKARKFTRNQKFVQTNIHDTELRDLVTGNPVEALAVHSDDASILIRAQEDSRFGVLVRVTDLGAVVQPVRIYEGKIHLLETTHRVPQMGFAGEVFAVGYDGHEKPIAADFATMHIRFEDAAKVWQRANPETEDSAPERPLVDRLVQINDPIKAKVDLPPEKANAYPAAINTLRKMLNRRNNLSKEEVIRRTVNRTAAAYKLTENERDLLEQKLDKQFKET